MRIILVAAVMLLIAAPASAYGTWYTLFNVSGRTSEAASPKDVGEAVDGNLATAWNECLSGSCPTDDPAYEWNLTLNLQSFNGPGIMENMNCSQLRLYAYPRNVSGDDGSVCSFNKVYIGGVSGASSALTNACLFNNTGTSLAWYTCALDQWYNGTTMRLYGNKMDDTAGSTLCIRDTGSGDEMFGFHEVQANCTLLASPVAFASLATNQSAPIYDTYIINHSVSITNADGFIFSWNASGVWTNASYNNINAAATSVSNVSSLSGLAGKSIGYKFYANDTSNAWSVSSAGSYDVVLAPSVSCGYVEAGDWIVNSGGTCYINDQTLTKTSGHVYVTNNTELVLNNTKLTIKSSLFRVNQSDNSKFRIVTVWNWLLSVIT